MTRHQHQEACFFCVVSWQVTIVTNNVPAVGGESGETRCQGDMEKADMVDGKLRRLGTRRASVWQIGGREGTVCAVVQCVLCLIRFDMIASQIVVDDLIQRGEKKI